MRNHLPEILRYELVLICPLPQETAPAGNVTGGHIELLPELSLDHHVPAAVGIRVELYVPVEAGVAQVWVTLPARQGAGARVGGALGLASAAWESHLAVLGAVTKLLTEVSRLATRADLIRAGQAGVVTRSVRHLILPLSVLAVFLKD